MRSTTSQRNDSILTRTRPPLGQVEHLGVDPPVFKALPEQPVVVKLEWSKLAAGWERQRPSIAGVIATSERRLDWTHVEHRAREL